MGQTPDRFPGIRYDEGLVLEQQVDSPQEVGEFRNVGGSLIAKDSAGSFNLRGSGGSLLGRAVFLTTGALVYSSTGDVVIKELE